MTDLDLEMLGVTGERAIHDPAVDALPTTRRRGPRTMLIVAGVIAALVLLGAVAAVLALFGGSGSEGDGSVATAGSADNAIAVADDTDGGAASDAGVPEPLSVAFYRLAENARVIASSAEDDAVLIARQIPGSEGQGCEGIGPREELVVMSTNGALLSTVAVADGFGFDAVTAGNRLVLTQGCEGVVELVALAGWLPSNELVVEAQPSMPDPALILYTPPVWSGTGDGFSATASGEDGAPVQVMFDAAGAAVSRSEPAARLVGEFANGSRVWAYGTSVSVGDPATAQPLQLDAEEWMIATATMSPDGRYAAVFAGRTLLVLDAAGAIFHEVSVPDGLILTAAWSPDGRLGYTTSVDGSVHLLEPGLPDAIAPIDPGLGTAKWYGLDFTAGGRAFAVSGFDELGRSIVVAGRLGETPSSGDGAALAPTSTGAVASPDGEPAGEPNYGILDEVLYLRGIGPVEFGMTVAEAEAALDADIVQLEAGVPGQTCVWGAVAGTADEGVGPRFMVIMNDGNFDTGIIRRVDLGLANETRSGIGFGDVREDVFVAYGDRVEVTPHKYTAAEGGEYLTFVPADADDANYRVVIETLGGTVTEVRAGLLPEVEFVEGCS